MAETKGPTSAAYMDLGMTYAKLTKYEWRIGDEKDARNSFHMALSDFDSALNDEAKGKKAKALEDRGILFAESAERAANGLKTGTADDRRFAVGEVRTYYWLARSDFRGASHDDPSLPSPHADLGDAYMAEDLALHKGTASDARILPEFSRAFVLAMSSPRSMRDRQYTLADLFFSLLDYVSRGSADQAYGGVRQANAMLGRITSLRPWIGLPANDPCRGVTSGRSTLTVPSA